MKTSYLEDVLKKVRQAIGWGTPDREYVWYSHVQYQEILAECATVIAQVIAQQSQKATTETTQDSPVNADDKTPPLFGEAAFVAQSAMLARVRKQRDDHMADIQRLRNELNRARQASVAHDELTRKLDKIIKHATTAKGLLDG